MANRIIITSDSEGEDSTMEIHPREDAGGALGLELWFHFEGQKSVLPFYLTQEDAKMLAKQIIDLT